METTSNWKTSTDTIRASEALIEDEKNPSAVRKIVGREDGHLETYFIVLLFDGTSIDPKTTGTNLPLTKPTRFGRNGSNDYEKDSRGRLLQEKRHLSAKRCASKVMENKLITPKRAIHTAIRRPSRLICQSNPSA